MKAIISLLAMVGVLSVHGQSVPSYRVNSMNDLLKIRINTGSIPIAWVANRTTNYQGGGGQFFYDGASRQATNRGTIFKPNDVEGRWVRSYESLETDFFGRSTEAINEALSFAERANIAFPRNVDLFITAPLLPKSYSTLIGNGARLMNGATNVSGLILMIIDRTIGTEVRGLRFDHQLGSHWNTGHLVCQGATNTSIHHCEFMRAGYLTSIMFQKSPVSGAICESPSVTDNQIGDQIYGGASTSAANLSIAESTRDAYVFNNRFTYSFLGTVNLGWVPLGQGNPNYPRLVASFDRGFNASFIDNTVINLSGATNLVGFMIEDNSGATNILNRVRGNTFTKVEIGVQAVQLRGAATISENIFDQCTRQGLDVSQVESVSAHQLAFLTVTDNLFLNCNPDPQMGQEPGTLKWRNDGGQIRYVSSLPYRMLFHGNSIMSWSTSTNATAFLFGSGGLTFMNNRIESMGNTNGYGLRAAEPYVLAENQNNALFEAYAANRKPLFATKNQFVGYAPGKAIFGLSDAFGDQTQDNLGKKVQWGDFKKKFPINSVNKLFQVRTVEANQTSIGNSGSWTAFIFLHLTNQDSTDFGKGNVGAHGRMFIVSHSVTEDTPPITATVVDAGPVGSQAKTGSRGYTGVTMTAASVQPHLTEIRLTAAGEGDVSEVNVYGTVMLVSSDMYMLPQIQP